MKLDQLTCHLLGLTLVVSSCFAEESNTRSSSVERVREDIRYLASDELEGRGVQTEGIRKAAEYIRAEFKRLGLRSGTKDGSYFQKFPVALREQADSKGSSLVISGPDGKKWELDAKQWRALGAGGEGKAKAELVFVGYGITAPDKNYDDYKGIDVEGKIVVIINREPQQNDKKSAFKGKELSNHASLSTKLRIAAQNKAAAAILVNDSISAPSKEKDALNQTGARRFGRNIVPVCHVKQELFNKIIGAAKLAAGDKALKDLAAIEKHIDGSLKPVSQALNGFTAEIETKLSSKSVEAENVIGILEGEGPLADETIVVGAHYDHLGYGGYGSRRPTRKEIHNGADDNATGTAAVVEMARRLATGKKPQRRVVFIAFSGEERGLVGARYYVENPVIPMDKTVAMFNYDMIGWLRKDELLIFGSKSAKEWESLIKKANEDEWLTVQLPGNLAGSDHIPFERKGTPVFHFFTNFTNTYHTPEDDFKTINVEGTVRVIDFSEKLLRLTLAMEKKPTYTKTPRRGFQRPATAYLGVEIDFGASGPSGTLIRNITPNSAAAKAGIKPGDRLVKIDKNELKTPRAIQTILRGKKIGDVIKITLIRDGKELSVQAKLTKRP